MADGSNHTAAGQPVDPTNLSFLGLKLYPTADGRVVTINGDRAEVQTLEEAERLLRIWACGFIRSLHQGYRSEVTEEHVLALDMVCHRARQLITKSTAPDARGVESVEEGIGRTPGSSARSPSSHGDAR